MANDVKLQEGHPLDQYLRPLKVGDKSSSIELSQSGSGCRINGDLDVTGEIKTAITTDFDIDNITCDDIVCDTLTTSGTITSGGVLTADAGVVIDNLTIDANAITSTSGLSLTVANTNNITFKEAGTAFGLIKESQFVLYSATGVTNEGFYIATTASGVTTISTTDNDGAVGHLNIEADGHVEFDGCAVGFDREEETFSGDDLLASGSGTGGTHDTHIDFRIGNKIYLQQTASMDQINLIFPNTSGNFLLYIRYDGDWSIGDWKVWASDLTAPTITDVTWPGGTQPDNTSGGRDIFSFYWDYDTETCFGVASLAFAAP